jgi:hypothetical protein
MKRWTPAKVFLFIIIVAPIAIFLIGGAVMLLWNNSLVPVLNVHAITFWQALGILVLSKILFSSFSGKNKSRRDQCKQRMMWNSMTAEQREKFKEEWNNRRRHWGNKHFGHGDETQSTENIG